MVAGPQPFDGTRSDVPSGATPFNAVNAADVTSATPVAIVAPVAGQSIFLTRLRATNIHASEVQNTIIEDSAAAEVMHIHVPAAGAGEVDLEFDPPIQLPVGTGLSASARASTGDVRVTASGYVGPA